MTSSAEVQEPRAAVRPRLSRIVSGATVAVAAVALGTYVVRVGPDLVGSWTSGAGDTGIVAFITAVLLVVILAYDAVLLGLARLVRAESRSRDAQAAGGFLLVAVGALTLLAAYVTRGGLFDRDDVYPMLVATCGVVLVVGGILVLWPARERPASH